MANRGPRQGISWQLIGMTVVLAGFFVMGIVWLLSGDGGDLSEPLVTALGSSVSEDMHGITEDGRPYMGAEDAPVTVYEFADFQCPHCRDFSQTYSRGFKQNYVATGDARLVWVNFPFMGDESFAAARAGHCAAEQDAFWSMHDWIFANQSAVNNAGAYNRSNLVAMADAIGLDTAAFEECLDDPATQESVQADRDFGMEAGVGSTPSFLVGDRLIEGGSLEQVDELGAAVDAAIDAEE